jgi:cell wall-associated NlpC family hydrolase
MASVDVTRILGSPWVQGGQDPETGMDCAGVVLWVFRELGLDREAMPCFPSTTENVTPDQLRETANKWHELHLSAKFRVGDVILSQLPNNGPPHVSVVVQDSPCMVATSIERSGVVIHPPSRINSPAGVYRWPAAAALVGAPC